MTKEEIIATAREAELIYWFPNSTFSDGRWWMDAGEPGDELERFAALIASRVATAAKAEEREECAKVCDDLTVTDGLHQAKYCANAIRARGETK